MAESREGHTLRSFDAALDDLRTVLTQFGDLVTEQLEEAVEALLERDADKARAVLVREVDANAFDTRVEEMALNLVARHAPKGGDLRAVFSMLKTGTDLERIGDEAKKIAKLALALTDDGVARDERLAAEVAGMSAIAASLLRQLFSAMQAGDESGVIGAAEGDRQMDKEYKAAVNAVHELLRASPDHLEYVADAVLTLKALERVGDHVKNIAKHYLFAVEGENVQHVKARDLRQKAGVSDS